MIAVDEFRVSEQFGWVHLEDGEGTTRISMPKNIWLEICTETLKSEGPIGESDAEVTLEEGDNYIDVKKGDVTIGHLYELDSIYDEDWEAESAVTGMSWATETKQQAIDMIVDETYDMCRVCGR
jgi:hypothetical protein